MQQSRRGHTPTSRASALPFASSSGSPTSSTSSGGGFVSRLRGAPRKEDSLSGSMAGLSLGGGMPPRSDGASPSHGTTVRSSAAAAMLTQAPQQPSALPDIPLVKRGTPQQSPALVPALKLVSKEPSSSQQQQQQHAERDRRLIAWQRQPTNISPATHLNLEPMLPKPMPHVKHRPLLVLDVDETLVHANFTPAKPYNVKVTIEVDGERGDIFVAYRPHLFTFLEAIAPMFEVAIFTASQSCYADQLLDAIDPQGRLGRLRLFREHCTEVNGARVKDLSLLGRPLHRVALIDNSPVTYLFQPRNAVPILSWFDDEKDTELLKLLPMLRQLAASESVYDVLDPWNCQR